MERQVVIDEFMEGLCHMRLISHDARPKITPLTGGVSAQIVRVETESEVVCVKRALPKLKVAADWIAPLERNTAEARWLKLVERLAPGIAPRVIAEDSDRHMFAMEYFQPSLFRVWKVLLLEGVALPSIAVAVGNALVKIHQATAHDPRVAEEFSNASSFDALRLNPYLGEAARVNVDISPVLYELIERTRATRVALVHGDVSPKNVLVSENRIVLLDAECATFGDPAFDLAFCLNHLLLKAAYLPGFTDAYFRCFRKLTSAYLDGVTWESKDALEYRTATLLPALLLARVDGKSPVEYLKDDDSRGRVRAFARRRLRNPRHRLSDLLELWSREGGLCR
jgi:5-methylthioribose kinase